MTASTEIASVLIGKRAMPCTADEEASLASCLLQRALLPWRAAHHTFEADTLDALAKFVRQDVCLRMLPDTAKVLVFAHDQIVPAPRCIAALAGALDRLGSGCAIACDSTQCAGADYLTWRGFERFAAARPAGETPVRLAAGIPLAMVARLGWLRQARQNDQAHRIDEAWVHDFSGYRKHVREALLDLVPARTTALLDVGGGNGEFLVAARKRFPACRTALCETSDDACAAASERVDRVFSGDFITCSIGEHFDCICFLDVLEHVQTPAAMLAKARSLLNPGGVIVASIPNVAHWSVVADLLEGRWDYAPAGIHCISHVRFFTRKGIEELFTASGLKITRWASELVPPPSWFRIDAMGDTLELDQTSLGTVAYHVQATPHGT